MIGALLGDGSISNNNVYKIAHCEAQKDYLEWKIKQFNDRGIRNTGIKSYIKTCGYNSGVPVYYMKLYMTPFTKVLRRVFYKPKKFLEIENFLIDQMHQVLQFGTWTTVILI